MIYQVLDWNKHFENNKSRLIDRCGYVCVPNKQDGMGLTRILDKPDGASIYGIWQLIVGALSRQRRPRDGWLSDNGAPPGTADTPQGHSKGIPWTLNDLALRWRRSVEEVQRALDVLSSPDVGWIKAYGKCPSSARKAPAKCPPGALVVPETGRRTEGTEGTEGTEPDCPCGADFSSPPSPPDERTGLNPQQWRAHNIERLRVEWVDWDQYGAKKQEEMIRHRMGEHYVPPADLPF